VDGVLVMNEVVDLATKKKSYRQMLIFKVNFEKACDSVCWVFIWSPW